MKSFLPPSSRSLGLFPQASCSLYHRRSFISSSCSAYLYKLPSETRPSLSKAKTKAKVLIMPTPTTTEMGSVVQIRVASPERTEELRESLADIRACIAAAAPVEREPGVKLVAVSKYKPSGDILACFEDDQRDFGENYVQELVDKAKELPVEIRWHFIGTLQSNKAKLLASVPNLHTVHTLSSGKTASILNKALPASRTALLNVLIQINTSGENAKSGLAPLNQTVIAHHSESICPCPPPPTTTLSDLQKLAKHIIISCPRLRLHGLMTIGSLDLSLSTYETEEENADFGRLKETRDVLQQWLQTEFYGSEVGEEGEGQRYRWGDERTGKLLLSMGMSSDFETALKAGSDVVRVGTGIFGNRKTKNEMKTSAVP